MPRSERIPETLHLLSWNMQGSGGDADKKARLRQFMKDRSLIAICLQECGALGDWRDEVEAAGWHLYDRPWGDNVRCSLAILARDEVRPHETDVDEDARRPMLGVRLRDRWVFTVHAPSGGCQAYIHSAVGAARRWAYEKHWIILGDFNEYPTRVHAHLDPPAQVARSGFTTQMSGGELDYVVHCGSGECTVTCERFGASDHAPIRVEWTP